MVHPDRARMLRAMTDHPMSVQDLSQSLGLNPGSVFRDLNNMNNAGLLTQEVKYRKSAAKADGSDLPYRLLPVGNGLDRSALQQTFY